MEQKIITSTNEFEALDSWISSNSIGKLFLVCDTSFQFLSEIRKYVEQVEETGRTPSGVVLEIVRFDDFQPNPLYDSVVKGVKLFRESGSDAIMAVGGGSAIDVAKCIKLYSNMDSEGADDGTIHDSLFTFHCFCSGGRIPDGSCDRLQWRLFHE